MDMTNYDIHEQAEGAIILDGLDTAILGIVEEFGNAPRILYSKEKIIDILVERDGMTSEEAIEYYDFKYKRIIWFNDIEDQDEFK